MRTHHRLVLTGLAAAFILAAAVSTASANRLSINEQGFAVVWQELSFISGSAQITCPITLAGSFHSRTIAKVNNALLGSIDIAVVGRCQGDGTATVLRETFPWHLAYAGHTGTLPRPTSFGLNAIGLSMRVADPVACLARTDPAEPLGSVALIDTSTGQIDRMDINGAYEIDLDDAEFFCDFAGDVSVTGSSSAIESSGGELLFIRLI